MKGDSIRGLSDPEFIHSANLRGLTKEHSNIRTGDQFCRCSGLKNDQIYLVLFGDCNICSINQQLCIDVQGKMHRRRSQLVFKKYTV